MTIKYQDENDPKQPIITMNYGSAEDGKPMFNIDTTEDGSTRKGSYERFLKK